MRKLLSLVLVSLCLQGQNAVGGKYSHGGSGSFGGGSGSGSYVGPGDITTFTSWWGLRCYATAYSSNVAQVWDSATGSTTETLLTCSSGGIINQTINSLATTCASGCVVKTLYDQAGGGFDVTQSTLALMPTYTANCIGSTKSCIAFTSNQLLVAGSGLGLFQPLSMSTVAERTSGFTTFTGVIGTSPNGTVQFGFFPSADNALLIAGTGAMATATDGVFHGMQALVNSTSSILSIDGTPTTVNAGGNGIAGDSPCLGKCTNGGVMSLTEAGIASGDISSSFIALNTNQHSYWGF